MEQKRKFSVLEEKLVYKSKWLSISQLATETDNNGKGTYDVVNKADCVSIIIENQNDEILLVKSYRFPTRIYEWELPMGGVDADEPPDSTAKRELNEETGLDEVTLRKIGKFYPIPGLSSQLAYLYYGKIDKLASDIAKNYGEIMDEIVDRKFFSYSEVIEMIKEGNISDGLTLSSLAIWKILGESK